MGPTNGKVGCSGADRAGSGRVVSPVDGGGEVTGCGPVLHWGYGDRNGRNGYAFKLFQLQCGESLFSRRYGSLLSALDPLEESRYEHDFVLSLLPPFSDASEKRTASYAKGLISCCL